GRSFATTAPTTNPPPNTTTITSTASRLRSRNERRRRGAPAVSTMPAIVGPDRGPVTSVTRSSFLTPSKVHLSHPPMRKTFVLTAVGLSPSLLSPDHTPRLHAFRQSHGLPTIDSV